MLRNVANTADDFNATTALLELGWNTEDGEDNWLISYADLLSVIFAMVVLLFGRMFATAVAAPDPAYALNDAQVAASATQVSVEAVEPTPASQQEDLARRTRRGTIQRPHRDAQARSRYRPGDPGRRAVHVRASRSRTSSDSAADGARSDSTPSRRRTDRRRRSYGRLCRTGRNIRLELVARSRARERGHALPARAGLRTRQAAVGELRGHTARRRQFDA